MLSTNSLNGVYKFLENTVYQKSISSLTSKGSTSVEFERALIEHFIGTCNKITQGLPAKPGSVIAESLKRYEIESIKALLRAKMEKLHVEETMPFIFPVGNLTYGEYREIFERSENVEEAVKLLAHTEYGPSLRRGFEDYQKTGTFLPLDISLDKHVFGNVWNAISDLHGVDEEVAREIIGTEVDLLNVKLVLRCTSMGFDEEMTKSYLIPIFYNLKEKNISNSIKTKDIESGIRALWVKPYAKAFATALEIYKAVNSLLPIELTLDKFLLKQNRLISVKYPSPFHIGTILSFLNLKWAEIKNLRAIARGVEAKTTVEKVKSALLLV